MENLENTNKEGQEEKKSPISSPPYGLTPQMIHLPEMEEEKYCGWCDQIGHLAFCPENPKNTIERPVYYNKFSQYICDKNDVPLVEVLGEDDRIGQFISEAINNYVQ